MAKKIQIKIEIEFTVYHEDCVWFVKFEGFMAVTMKNAVFWDIMPCASCKIRHVGGTYRLLHQGGKNRWTRNNASSNYQPTHAVKKYQVVLILVFLSSVRRLVVTASVVLNEPSLVSLMKDALNSSETSDLTRATRRKIQKDTILVSDMNPSTAYQQYHVTGSIDRVWIDNIVFITSL
jgi:hypothetical protein